ncbi:MAG TPA: hypothetical protein VFQ14_04350 [Thermoleophilaceae bacterium]|nr:hypothetical protein [Thermoleophilaceae bacterium]
MLTVYDELPHQARGEEQWRESWYLNFFDHAQDLYGIAWMGIRPNSGHGEVLFAVGQGPRFLTLHQDFEIPIPQDIGRERAAFGALAFTVDEPYRKWRVQFSEGSTTADLEWTAIAPVYNWEWQETARSWHYQHPGRVTGRISIGDLSFEIDGVGERDRAWGKRDNRYFDAVHWTTAQFADGLHFESMAVALGADRHLYGFAQADDQASLLTDLTVEPRYAYPGGPPASAEIVARDQLGRDFRVRQEILNVIPIASAIGGAETRMYFTFNRYECGGVSGMGMTDHWWSEFDSLKESYVCEGPNRGRLFALDEYG